MSLQYITQPRCFNINDNHNTKINMENIQHDGEKKHTCIPESLE